MQGAGQGERSDHPRMPLNSDTLKGFQPTGSDRRHELLIVPLVLIRVPPGEVGDRCVERIARAQVLRNGDWIPDRSLRSAPMILAAPR